MKQEGLQYFTEMNIPIAGFLIFLIIFIVLAYRVCRIPKPQIEALSHQPLRDEGDHND